MNQSRRITVEVCIESVDDALTAARVGADRLELCSALSLGGLTPTGALIESVRAAVDLPLMVLVRPRPGGFCYSDSEMALLLKEIDRSIDAGADGIVTGVLLDDGQVDAERCRGILRAAAEKSIVFHRAFDFTPRPIDAMNALIDLGFTRILTSGQRSSSIEGADLIRQLVEKADRKIEILPGGGINASNAIDLLTRAGCSQIHASCRDIRIDPSVQHRPNLPLASNGTKSPNQHGFTSEQRLAELIAKVR